MSVPVALLERHTFPKHVQPPMVSPADLRSLAEQSARVGGSILLDARTSEIGTIREKARNDFVTEVDAASERAIGAFILKQRPGDRVTGEEGTSGGLRTLDGVAADSRTEDVPASPGRTWVEWIVDPLDGTKNFIHGYPVYGVSVAARGPDGILAGAVLDPTRDELFSAARGAGATLNGAAIHVSVPESPARALIGTGFPFRFDRLVEPYLESFRRVIEHFSDVRRAGSASLDLAYVACGRLDGFWELALSPWDIAAGWLLIEEAGGTISDDEGGRRMLERGHVVGGSAAIHMALLEQLRPALTGRVDGFRDPPR